MPFQGIAQTSQGKQINTNSLCTKGMTSQGAASVANSQLPSNSVDKLKVANSGGFTKNAFGMIIPSYLANGSSKPAAPSNKPKSGGPGKQTIGITMPKLPKTGDEWGQHGFIPPSPAEMAAHKAGKTVSDAGQSLLNMFSGAKSMLGKFF